MDQYCWVCHTSDKSKKKDDLNCSKCGRSFHVKCLTQANQEELQKSMVCKICVEIEKQNDSNTDEHSKTKSAKSMEMLLHFIKTDLTDTVSVELVECLNNYNFSYS